MAVLAPCSLSVPLGPHSYVSCSVGRSSDSESLLGEFRARSTLSAFLLYGSQLTSLLEHPGSPAQFYLVGEDVGPEPSPFVWTQSLLVYYTSPAPA